MPNVGTGLSEAPAGVPIFIFSKTSFSALWILFIYFDWLSLTLTFRNLFGQEYCHGHKRVARKEVKEAYEALTKEKKAVRLCLYSSFKSLSPQGFIRYLRSFVKRSLTLRTRAKVERCRRSFGKLCASKFHLLKSCRVRSRWWQARSVHICQYITSQYLFVSVQIIPYHIPQNYPCWIWSSARYEQLWKRGWQITCRFQQTSTRLGRYRSVPVSLLIRKLPQAFCRDFTCCEQPWTVRVLTGVYY